MRWLLSGCTALLLAYSAWAVDPMDRASALIQQLGDAEFAKRKLAARELESLGENILPALRQAVRADENLEVRSRAQKVIQAIVLAARKSKSTGMVLELINASDFQM